MTEDQKWFDRNMKFIKQRLTNKGNKGEFQKPNWFHIQTTDSDIKLEAVVIKTVLQNGKYYFVIVGNEYEKNVVTGQNIKARQHLIVHKKTNDPKNPLVKIHEVALNNRLTQSYPMHSRTYAIYGPKIYYFVIQNKEKNAQLQLHSYHFLNEKEEIEQKDSNNFKDTEG